MKLLLVSLLTLGGLLSVSAAPPKPSSGDNVQLDFSPIPAVASNFEIASSIPPDQQLHNATALDSRAVIAPLRIDLWGTMSLVDIENWPFTNQYKDWNWGAISTTMSSTFRHKEFSTLWACVGGEVRGELFLVADYFVESPDWIRIIANVKYFEGTSCYTTNLHRRTPVDNPPFVWVRRGRSYIWNLPRLSDVDGAVGNSIRMTLSA